uniref:HMG box domain-containing protein n=1 Tax=Lotharella oceanica TaxID=641309 RepID=A0A7S2XAF7_9EUKA|mmetsp:Transcript_2322/g.4427  ORF Transcript_2322/g.4427 Transcript_2322/m.4427 type:complete len:100 (+) Transcript_2322:261-560(+)
MRKGVGKGEQRAPVLRSILHRHSFILREKARIALRSTKFWMERSREGRSCRVLGKRWRGMSDVAKAPYVQKTAAEKEVYKKELKAYKAAKKARINSSSS